MKPGQFEDRYQEDTFSQDLSNEMGSVIESLSEKTRDAYDDMADSVLNLSKIFDRMVESTSEKQVRRSIKDFELYSTEVSRLTSGFEEMFGDIKKFMDEDEATLLENLFEQQKEQVKLYNLYYEKNMKKERKTLKTFFKEAKDGMDALHDKFGTITDIANAINLNSLRDGVLNGSETTLDILSEVARIRGMSIEDVEKIKKSLTEGDTFGGTISASDIMSIWRMSGISSEYLEEIDSYLALFQKQTQTSNEDLSELVYWSKRNGRNSEDLFAILDDISSTRTFDGIDSGEVLRNLSEMVNYLNEDRISEYIAASAAAFGSDLNLDVINTAIREAADGSISGEVLSMLAQIEAFGGLTPNTLRDALENADYDTLISEYSRAMQNIGKKSTEEQKIVQDSIGVTLEDIQKFTQIELDEFSNLISEISKNTDSVDSLKNTVGYISDYDKVMNEQSTSWVGDFFDKFEVWTKDHPILTSIAGAATTGIISGITTILGGAVVGWFTKGKLGKVLKHSDDIAKAADAMSDAAKAVDAAADAGKSVDAIVDATKAVDAATDAVKAADSAVDAVKAADAAKDTAKAAESGSWLKKLVKGVDIPGEFKNVAKMAKDADGVKDFLKTLKASPLGAIFGDVVLDGALGALIYNLSDSEYEKSGAMGSTAGSIAGDVAGWLMGGPLGGLALGWAGDVMGEEIGKSAHDGERNWGNVLAGDWNPLHNLWRKDGTVDQQNQRKLEAMAKYQRAVEDKLAQEWVSDKNDQVEELRAMLVTQSKTGDIDLSKFIGMDEDEFYILLEEALGVKLSRPNYYVAPGSSTDFDVTQSSVDNVEGLILRSGLIDKMVDIFDLSSQFIDPVENLTTEISEMTEWLKKVGYDTLFWSEDKIVQAYMMAQSQIMGGGLAYSPTIQYMEVFPVNDILNNPSNWTDGSHKSGLTSVPYDGYIAELHKDERVLTADEAKAYNEGVVVYSDGDDENVVHIDSTVEEIAEILSKGFEFLGKKIENINIKVNNIERVSRTSTTSRYFAN